jgi:Casjensviridae DNA polymerase
LISYLHLDFESRSSEELQGPTSVGLHNYWLHSSTQPLMLAYAYGDEPVKLWEPHKWGIMPDDLRQGLEDPKQSLAAWNSAFERYGLKYKLNLDTAIERWFDPQASARYLSLPGALDKVGSILGLPFDYAKDKRGSALIDLFSYPHTTRKKKGEIQTQFFNDWNSHPLEWQEFCEYCRQDIVAERELMRRLQLLRVFPLPEKERQIWVFDQKINDRGLPVDIQFVKNMYELGSRSKKEAVEKQNQLTGLENANSPLQMLAWAKEQGYEPTTLKKDTVTAQLKYSTALTPLCRQVLEARKAASSTTYKKLSAILRQISPDFRLRNQFIYMGSARCGRWSGNAVQLQNMARPDQLFEDETVVDYARNLVYKMDYDGIFREYGSVLLTVKNLIRTVFVAPLNRRLNVADLNAIETRVGAWVAQCPALLEVFRPRPGKPNGNDPYLDFAMKMTGILYEMLERDIHSKDPAVKAAAKRHRQIAKPGVLGCIYRLGGGSWGKNKYGDTIKTGLWGYAEAMGVEMTQEQAHEVVRIFREAYQEICQAWYDLENLIAEVLAPGTTKVKREFGPRGCVKIDKLTITQAGNRRHILRIQLPNGRFLHYMDAEIQDVMMPWKAPDGSDVYKPSLTYSGLDQETKVWKLGITSHGGKVFENIVQGIARDVLAEKLLEFEAIGIEIEGHAHDEGIGETVNDAFTPGVQEMVAIMSEPVKWAPDLLLGADGFEGPYYHK